jgi:predicted amidohydrolase YtcJ
MSPSPGNHYPDLILNAGSIHVLDQPGHTVQALAVKDGRVLEIGPWDDLLALAGPSTDILDLEGTSVLPGLTDGHIHLTKYARSLAQVDCGTETIEACLAHVALRAKSLADADDWVLGHGWDQNLWSRFGTAKELDRATGQHPAYLTAKSLHAAWANSRALRVAGIDDATADPPGGKIQRDDQGRPTGILFEGAMSMVASRVSHARAGVPQEDLLRAQESLWAMGLTGIHDFDGQECFVALQQLRESRHLGLRVVKNILADDLQAALDVGLRSGFGDVWIRIGNIKLFADGALGPHTAAMIRPYDGEPENLGVLLMDEEDILALATASADGGLAMTIHAIGDRANHVVLNAYESLRHYEDDKGLPHRRHRIEHLQLLHPDDIDRPVRLGLIASMQPIHALSDRDMADQYWGERVKNAYAWRNQLQMGTTLVFGSDAPVDSPNPFLGIFAAIARGPLPQRAGLGPWHPEQRIPLWDALRAYTYGPAFASGQEDITGCLLPGRLADLIVLEEDVFNIDPVRLLDTKVMGTMIDGVWRLKRF